MKIVASNELVEPADGMDIRPILKLVRSNELPFVAGSVCRRYGCAKTATRLGFCESCHAVYELDIARNALIHAVVCESFAYIVRHVAADGLSPYAVAEVAIDALFSGDVDLARSLLVGNPDSTPVKASCKLAEKPNSRDFTMKVLHDT